MSTRKIGYWIATGLVALSMGAAGTANLLRVPDVVAISTELGYPLHFTSILGAGKLLGAAAILAPGLPRLKEWAYAGIVINLACAALSHAAVGHPAWQILNPLVQLVFVFASWALRPESRKLASGSEPAAESAPRAASAQAA